MQSSIMRQLRGSQGAQVTGKLPVVFALAVAVMGIINGLTVLLPTRPGRLALLGSLLNQLAPFAPSILPVLDTGRTLALILGDPICPPEATERVTRGFLDLCAANDWQVAFYQVHPEHLPTYRALGLHVFKIGEEALLSPQTFTLSGSAMANVRTNCRRAEREGVTIQWYDGMPPKEVLEQLEPLSSAWLERKAGKHAAEMGFSMGRLDGLVEAAARADALAETQLAGEDLPHDAVPRLVTGVATEQTGRACAFVTFTPIYGSARTWGWAVDLMRRAPSSPATYRPSPSLPG